MNGITILETTKTITDVNFKQTIVAILAIVIFCVTMAVIFNQSLMDDRLIIGIVSFIMLIGSSIGLYNILHNPIIKQVELDYEQIIAYVDEDILTFEQIMTKYNILDKNDDGIYILEIENKTDISEIEIKDKEKDIHRWIVENTERKNRKTIYYLRCKDCEEERRVVNDINNKTLAEFIIDKYYRKH